jgi:succinoglycan biosynthesis protein ExoW
VIAVIIPFFQRETGILQRALRSVALQTCLETTDVLVVDDGSPVSAVDEVSIGQLSPHVRVHVIRKENGGPSSARNAALDALPESARYVAFLDSDDTWRPDHLARAVESLSQGFDVYFSDIVALNGQSWLRAKGRDSLWAYPRVEHIRDVCRFDGSMFDQIVHQTVLNTSTVVARVEAIGGSRFDEALFSAGEDQLFFLDLAEKQCRFCYSLLCEAEHGRGVNIHQDTCRGTTKEQVRLMNEVRYIKRVLARRSVSAGQSSELKRALWRVRKSYIGDVLHGFRVGAHVDWRLQLRQLLEDPATGVALPAALVAGIRARLSKA